MKTIEYNKLVRDKIPDIIEKKGLKYEIELLSDFDEINEWLKNKLFEEVIEFVENENLDELSDIWQVILKIMDHNSINTMDLYDKMSKKLEERGGFDKNILLRWVEDK